MANLSFSNSKLNGLSEELKHAIEEVIAPFERYRDDQVIRYLWKLTSQPEYAMAKMQFTDEEIEQLLTLSKKIRNEIISRFDKAGLFELPENYDKNLFDALGGDKVAYKSITDKVDNAILMAHIETLKEAHRLLHHSNIEKVFGGLRALGFDKFEANYILPKGGSTKVVEAIRDYFDLSYNDLPADWINTSSNTDEESASVETISTTPTPVQDMGETGAVDEKAVQLVVKTLNNKDDLNKLYTLIDKLSVEFDINDLISRRDMYQNIAATVNPV